MKRVWNAIKGFFIKVGQWCRKACVAMGRCLKKAGTYVAKQCKRFACFMRKCFQCLGNKCRPVWAKISAWWRRVMHGSTGENGVADKMSIRVDSRVGWCVIGFVLVVAFTLGVVAACLAFGNTSGATTMTVLGSIAAAVCLVVLVGYIIAHAVADRRAAAAPVEPDDLPQEATDTETDEETSSICADSAEPAFVQEEAAVAEVQAAPLSVVCDEEPQTLNRRGGSAVGKKFAVNVDVIARHFAEGEVITVNRLKTVGLVPPKCATYKVLARGTIDKALIVVANAFSQEAIDAIVQAGGQAVVY